MLALPAVLGSAYPAALLAVRSVLDSCVSYANQSPSKDWMIMSTSLTNHQAKLG